MSNSINKFPIQYFIQINTEGLDPREDFSELLNHLGVKLEFMAFLCHKTTKAPETTRCSACHQKSFNPELPGRMGLKGAHHRQCMGCHKKWNMGPVGCTECHPKNVPDHKELVKLSRKPEPTEVIKECLRCHDVQAEEMLTSTHWLWKGPSPFTEGYEKRIDLGKATKTINNFLIGLVSNWPRCTSCHAGYGWKDATFDFTDKTRIDCLVCHDTTKTYVKAPMGAGMPDPRVDLEEVRHERPVWIERLEQTGKLESQLVPEASGRWRALFYAFGYFALAFGVFLLIGGLVNSTSITW